MIFGMDTFTFVHTLLSVVALIAGFFAVAGLFGPNRQRTWTTIFIITAVATSATGFGLPSSGLMPSHYVGIVALVVLAAVLAGRYLFHLAGPWRPIYGAGVVLSLYFLVFVTIAQAFAKIPALHAMAPTQAEPPFAVAQGIVLVIFVVLTIAAAIKFRPAPTV
jgi:hypothetical protein